MKNKITKFKNYSIIHYTNRKGKSFEILVDNDIIDKLIDYGYSVHAHWVKNSNAYYATITKYLGIENGKSKNKSIELHRFVLEFPVKIVDHKNHNTLDCRRENLRETNKSTNCRNRKDKNSNNSSGYRNVSCIKNWWRVQLQIDGKNHLFSEKFTNVHKAGKFAKEMRKKYYEQ